MEKTILYVDNNHTFTEGLKKILEEKGYQMNIATDSEEAIELTKKISPQIIFIDMETPPDNGLETYLKVRKINRTTPVVIVTEEWDNLRNLTWEAMNNSAYTCLYKPFEVDEMLELIELITGSEFAPKRTENTSLNSPRPELKVSAVRKNKGINNILNLLLLGLFSFGTLWAEEFVGHSGADFLKQSVGVRASALGEAVVALGGDVFAPSWNPAVLAELKRIEIGFMHSEMIMNAKTDFFGVTYPTRIGNFGLSGIFFAPEAIPLTDEIGKTFGEIKWFDYALTFSYARRVSNRLSLGFNLKTVRRQENDPIFGETKGQSLAGEIGLIYSATRNLDFGFSLLNYGEKIQMEREKRKDDLPRTIRVGLAYEWQPNRLDGLTFSLDLNKTLEAKWRKNIGIEYSLERIIFLRTGYLEKTGNILGLTYGLGIKIGNYQLDYANVPASEMIGYTRTNKVSFLVQF